jgi:hypothetical protein
LHLMTRRTEQVELLLIACDCPSEQVELLLRKVAVQSSTRLDEDMLVRRIGAMLQDKLQEKRPEKRPEELQKL